MLLVGMAMVSLFLDIEARRCRIYDIWRSRVRLLEENVFANALDPEGVEQSNWRELLSEDLRKPTIKTPTVESVSRRLSRVYAPPLSVLVGAWFVRLTVFATPPAGMVEVAAIGSVPGEIVLGVVGCFYVLMLVVTFWPGPRQAKGELRAEAETEQWK